MRGIISHSIGFIVLVLVQVLIVNNIQLGQYLNPYLYVMFILLLPGGMPKPILLIPAFLIGLAVDMFSNTAGMHAAACVFMAFCRPRVLHAFAGDDRDLDDPGIATFGLKGFLYYTFILVFLHHIFLFYTEVFHFRQFFSTLLRSASSALLTTLLILTTDAVFYNRTGK